MGIIIEKVKNFSIKIELVMLGIENFKRREFWPTFLFSNMTSKVLYLVPGR